MRELRFHREVYAGTAIDEAVKKFARFADMRLLEQPEHFVVQVVAKTPDRERRVAGELANWALGLTVERGGVDP